MYNITDCPLGSIEMPGLGTVIHYTRQVGDQDIVVTLKQYGGK